MLDIFKVFVPWIIFSTLLDYSHQSIAIASGIALVVHFFLNKCFIGRYVVFDVGTLIFFILMLLNAFIFHYAVITNNAYLLANAAMAVIAWLSLLIKKPLPANTRR